MTADFPVTIYNRKIFTLWHTEASESVISEKCLQKIHCTDKVHPSAGIRLPSVSDSNISPIGILTLYICFRAYKSEQNFIICRNIKRPLTLGLDFHHQFGIECKLGFRWETFPSQIWKTHFYTRTQKSLARIYTVEYQAIQPYITMIIKTKLDPSTRDDQGIFLLTADSTFTHNNPNLKCHQTLINSNNLCNNLNLPLILTNNLDHKICISCTSQLALQKQLTT